MSQPYNRAYNFSPGPCTLPVEVLEQARDGMMNWNGTGMSMMELSHRGKAFEKVLADAQADLRQLLGIPENYKIMFLQGGASLQNTMVPMNLLNDGVADYIVTGSWGKKSEEAANLVGCVNKIYDGKSHNYSTVPAWDELKFTPGASFIHYTSNETIQGVEFQTDPPANVAPVVCDMSSDILSRPFDFTRYALVYAGAQKNQGPAGVTLVIMRDDLLERTPQNFHPMLDYRLMAENDSMYNTPPTWNIYICSLVYKWVLGRGGVARMLDANKAKAQVLYDAIDNSGGFYKGHAQKECRSLMNVTFTLAADDLTDTFVKEAQALKLDGLKGHRSVGGCRASIYNAFPHEGCVELAGFMKEFAAKNG